MKNFAAFPRYKGKKAGVIIRKKIKNFDLEEYQHRSGVSNNGLKTLVRMSKGHLVLEMAYHKTELQKKLRRLDAARTTEAVVRIKDGKRMDIAFTRHCCLADVIATRIATILHTHAPSGRH